MGVFHRSKRVDGGSGGMGASVSSASDAGRKRLKVALGAMLAGLILVAGFCYFTGDGEQVTFRVLPEKEVPQQITSQVIPEYRTLERALACVVDGKVYVVATRGEKPTSGYEISIENMELVEKDGKSDLTVCTLFRDPEPGTSLTQVVTYPLQVAETDLEKLPDTIRLKVQYAE